MSYALFADNKDKPNSFLVIEDGRVVNGNWYVQYVTPDLVIISAKRHPHHAADTDCSWIKIQDLDPNDPREYNDIIEDYRRTL